jgi:hypothetical protein
MDQPESGEFPQIGLIGRTVSELKPGGNAAYADALTNQTRIVPVISDVGYIASGTEVIVRTVANNSVIVRPAP